jgi:hypothetical protein
MEILKFKDLIIGQYYKHLDGNENYIVQFDGSLDYHVKAFSYIYCSIINDYNTYYHNFNCSILNPCKNEYIQNNFIPATPEEIAWFIACEQAGKLVDKPKLIMCEIW